MGLNESKLRKDEQSYIMEHTHFTKEQIKEFRSKFKGDFITRKDFVAIVSESKSYEKNREDLLLVLNHMFDVYDTDDNQLIDFREFMIGLSVSFVDCKVEEKCEFIFKFLDLDNDGFIDKSEITTIIRSMLTLVNKCMDLEKPFTIDDIGGIVKMFFNICDKNGDQKICINEFIEAAISSDKINTFLHIFDSMTSSSLKAIAND